MRAGAPVLVLVLACAALAGCGSAAGTPHRVAAWRIEAPYFAPPEPTAPVRSPAALARCRRRPRPPRPPTPAPRPTPRCGRAQERVRQGLGRSIDTASLTSNGLATPPPTAPNKLVAIIQAANAVARKPYVYGGGHGRFAGEIFSDSAYDCSGSVSYALAAAGLLDSPDGLVGARALRQAGPGQVGDDLRQRRPRVDDRSNVLDVQRIGDVLKVAVYLELSPDGWLITSVIRVYDIDWTSGQVIKTYDVEHDMNVSDNQEVSVSVLKEHDWTLPHTSLALEILLMNVEADNHINTNPAVLTRRLTAEKSS